MPEAWELRKKGYPTPAKASAQNDSGGETRCRIVKTEKALLDCLAFGEFGPSVTFGARYGRQFGPQT